MQIGSDKWINLLLTGCEQLKIQATLDQATQFSRFATVLLEWNRKINLTSIVDPVEIAVKHFLDSLAPATHIPSQGNLLDIGTGGGFPGIPLKIIRPQQSMVLIDSVRKKINFVKHVMRELQLTNIEAQQIRAEDFNRSKIGPPCFDIIVSRALADIDIVCRLAAPLLKPAGRMVIYKGPQTNSSADDQGKRSVQCENRHFNVTYRSYLLPHSCDRRTAVILECCS